MCSIVQLTPRATSRASNFGPLLENILAPHVDDPLPHAHKLRGAWRKNNASRAHAEGSSTEDRWGDGQVTTTD